MVLSRDEVARLLSEMDGVTRLMAVLLYGSGLRLMECVHKRDLSAGLGAVWLPHALDR
jgi:site-specific recombinase XerD